MLDVAFISSLWSVLYLSIQISLSVTMLDLNTNTFDASQTILVSRDNFQCFFGIIPMSACSMTPGSICQMGTNPACFTRTEHLHNKAIPVADCIALQCHKCVSSTQL